MNIFLKNKKLHGGKSGMTLVETLVYIFIFVLLLTVVINSLVAMTRSYRTIQSVKEIESSADVTFERLTREIRAATSVDVGQSSLGVSNGALMLNTTDDSGDAATIKFFVSNGSVRVLENGVDVGPLTSSQVSITNLTFTHLVTAQSRAVRVVMTAQSGVGDALKTKNFYSTIVLRGSYSQQ